MAKHTQKPRLQNETELKQAVKAFVLMNVTELLAARENDETTSELVGKLIIGLANEALDELLTSLVGIAAIKGRSINV